MKYMYIFFYSSVFLTIFFRGHQYIISKVTKLDYTLEFNYNNKIYLVTIITYIIKVG